MANILANRVSATLTPEQIAETKAALLKVRETLPFLVGLTKDERKSLAKISTVNRSFTESAIAAISSNPDIFPLYLDVKEIRTDLTLYDQLDEIVKLSNQVTESLRDTQIIAGSEAYVSALTGYKFIAAAAKGGVQGAKSVYDDLKKRFEGQGGGAVNSETPLSANKN
ncbi:MAG: hypothetical protein KA165_02635 [Saprospiraceae bacterium]|nr:hypothetical protein [Saprospiraceae bacterium]